MKKLFILLVACLVVIGFQSYVDAANRHHSTPSVVTVDHDVVGVKVDAPNLVTLTTNTTLGLEGGKDVLKDVLYSDTRDYFEADKGYFVYLKVTYSGCLLNCKEEEKEIETVEPVVTE
jgi:hypothetical protein